MTTQSSQHELPHFVHPIHGANLHAFIRSMASVENYHEITTVLEWMVLNQSELGFVADQTANGRKLLRRTVIAARVFCEGTPYENRARGLLDNLEDWGGWPTDNEVLVYLSKNEADDASQSLEEEERERDVELEYY